MHQEIDSLLELTDPDLFDVVPKAAVRQQLASLGSDENMRITFENFTFDHIGEVVTYRQENFAPVSCHQRIVYHLLSAEYRAPEVRDRMVRMLEKRHGFANVSVSTARHTISVTAEKSLFAIRRGPGTLWNFIEYRPENAAILDLLLPPVVRSMVGMED